MIKHKMTPWVLAASLALPAGFAWSETSAVENAEEIQNEMAVDAARLNAPDDVKSTDDQQKHDYWKEVSEDSLEHYNKTLKTHGPSSDLTKDAEDRHNAAAKEFKASQTSLGKTRVDQRNPSEADKEISAK